MSNLVHRNLKVDPPIAISGQGIWLREASGHEVIDGSGGAAVACLGHGHPHVLAAMRAQLEKLTYAHTALFSCESAEKLADMLVGHAPGGLTHAYFVSSGSEGMEAAIKMARQYFVEIGQPQRKHYIARKQSYHGNTLGALSAGGNAMRRAPYAPILSPAFSHVSACYAYRDRADHESDADYVQRLADELEAEFSAPRPRERHRFLRGDGGGRDARLRRRAARLFPGDARGLRPARRAAHPRRGDVRHGPLRHHAFLGAGGHHPRHPGHRQGPRRRLPADRRHPGPGQGHRRHPRRLRRLHAWPHLPGASHGLRRGPRRAGGDRGENLLGNVQAMGALLEQRLTERLGNHRNIGDIRGRGLFWAIELVQDRGTKAVFDPKLKMNERVKKEAYDRGLGCYPMGGTIDGLQGDHVILAPPYTVTAEEIEMIVDRFGAAVEAALAG
jgi:adenosylmethionine-8-amino-7-oxononanoate aminotransferase